MAGSAETEALRAMCRRFCVVDGSKPEEEQQPSGYFRFDAGASVRKARKIAAQVVWTEDPTDVFQQCLDRVLMLEADGHPFIWVAAIPTGETHPVAKCKFEGDISVSIGEDTDTPTGANAAAEALAIVSLGLLKQNDNLFHQAQQLTLEREDRALQALRFGLENQMMQDQDKAAMVRATFEALGPTLEAVMPQVLEGLGMGAASDAAPTDPHAAITWHMEAIENQAQGLAQILQREGGPAALDATQRARLAQFAMVAAQLSKASPPPSDDADIQDSDDGEEEEAA